MFSVESNTEDSDSFSSFHDNDNDTIHLQYYNTSEYIKYCCRLNNVKTQLTRYNSDSELYLRPKKFIPSVSSCNIENYILNDNVKTNKRYSICIKKPHPIYGFININVLKKKNLKK